MSLPCEKEEKGPMLALTIESLAKEVVGQIFSAENDDKLIYTLSLIP